MDEEDKRRIRRRDDMREAVSKARASLRAVEMLVGVATSLNEVSGSDLAFLVELIGDVLQRVEDTTWELDKEEREALEAA